MSSKPLHSPHWLSHRVRHRAGLSLGKTSFHLPEMSTSPSTTFTLNGCNMELFQNRLDVFIHDHDHYILMDYVSLYPSHSTSPLRELGRQLREEVGLVRVQRRGVLRRHGHPAELPRRRPRPRSRLPGVEGRPLGHVTREGGRVRARCRHRPPHPAARRRQRQFAARRNHI